MSKALSWEDRQTRELEFVQKYVENGGNATEAAKAVGVSDNSASTVGHRLKNRLSDEIETEQSASLSGYAVKAVSYLKFLAESAKSESVRLGAIKDILDRAGFKSVDRQEIHQVSEFAGWSDEELNAEYHKLLRAELKKNTQDGEIQTFLEHQEYIDQGWQTYIGV